MFLELLTFSSIVTWLVTVLIGLTTWFLANHLLLVWTLPPGPFPLPLTGNSREFRGEDKSYQTVIGRLANKYKDIFTIWLGPNPTVIVCNWELCKEALVNKKFDFSGRYRKRALELFFHGHYEVSQTDYGPRWEALRKVFVGAVRKFAISGKLPELMADIADRTTDLMSKEGKPVDANTYFYLMIYNVTCSIAFGQRFELDDAEFLALREAHEKAQKKFVKGFPSDDYPWLNWYYRGLEQSYRDVSEEFLSYFRRKYAEHKQHYQRNNEINDFTYAVLSARDDAEDEGKDCLQYLTNESLTMLQVNVFGAGTDSTRLAILWTLLTICDDLEIQKKMREEIDNSIGSRIPRQTDRDSCPYTYSVVLETLRLRPVADLTMEHKVIRNTELGGYKLSKGTRVMFHIISSHYNEDLWEEPEKFKPERFLLEDGTINPSRVGFMPFGMGRRMCAGEKLAMVNIFLIITRMIQTCYFELEGGPGSISMKPDRFGFANRIKPYNLVVTKRNTQN